MLILNGKVFVNGKIEDKVIRTDGEILKSITNTAPTDAGDEEVINAKGLLILPGLIDPHVHLREPGAEHKEDFKTGTCAAVAGGITTVIDMPNNPIPTITAGRLKEKMQLATQKAVCDVYFHFGTTEDNFEEVKKANPRSLKMYLSETTGDLIIKDKNAIKKHFENFPRKILVHAEGEKLISELATIVETKGKNLHLTHATTKSELEIVKKINATTDVTPHHLFLSKRYEEVLGKLALVKPPLSPEAQRIELWKSLDRIDCIVTDHAPHTLEDKMNGAYGFPGLETSLALMLKAYHEKMISLEEIVQKMAMNPARIFGFQDRGEIAVGKKADLTFVDLRHEWTVKGEEFETKCRWSPFHGWKLKGKVMKVVFRGELIYDEEFLVAFE